MDRFVSESYSRQATGGALARIGLTSDSYSRQANDCTFARIDFMSDSFSDQATDCALVVHIAVWKAPCLNPPATQYNLNLVLPPTVLRQIASVEIFVYNWLCCGCHINK